MKEPNKRMSIGARTKKKLGYEALEKAELQ